MKNTGNPVKFKEIKRRYTKIIAVILLIILSVIIFIIFNILNKSSDDVEISVLAPPRSVNKGQDFNIDIIIDPANKPVSAAQFDLIFNGSVINIRNVTDSSLFKQGSLQSIFNPGIINNSMGSLMNVWGVIITPGMNVTSKNTFVTVTMEAKNAGTSSLGLKNVIISGPGDNSYQVRILNGSINVE